MGDRSNMTYFIGTKTEEESDRSRLKKDIILNATPKQIDNYIENNITDLESAKQVLKLIAKIAILRPQDEP